MEVIFSCQRTVIATSTNITPENVEVMNAVINPSQVNFFSVRISWNARAIAPRAIISQWMINTFFVSPNVANISVILFILF